MASYFSVIGMSVFYSFIIFGSIFVYYYLKFLRWMPSNFPIEMLATLLFALIFLNTSIRTFVKKADAIFLTPMETELTSYFRKSMFLSGGIDALRFIIILIIIHPLLRDEKTIHFASLLIFTGLLILNIHLAWMEQWLHHSMQRFIHRLIRFVTFSVILYCLFMGNWMIAGGLFISNVILWSSLYKKKPKGVNWTFLSKQEEKSLIKLYRFINLFIDVPHLKHAFRRRTLLGWGIKKGIPFQQNATFVYLFSHLFFRYNEYYYLYVRLTLVGMTLLYFFPAYGWLITAPIFFLSGYQLLPLQHSINDNAHLYPIPIETIKKSFKKVLWTLLLVQFIVFNIASLGQVTLLTSGFKIVLEVLFIYWFVHMFIAKRIFQHPL